MKWLHFGKVQEKIFFFFKWFMFKEQFIQIELLLCGPADEKNFSYTYQQNKNVWHQSQLTRTAQMLIDICSVTQT